MRCVLVALHCKYRKRGSRAPAVWLAGGDAVRRRVEVVVTGFDIQGFASFGRIIYGRLISRSRLFRDQNILTASASVKGPSETCSSGNCFSTGGVGNGDGYINLFMFIPLPRGLS